MKFHFLIRSMLLGVACSLVFPLSTGFAISKVKKEKGKTLCKMEFSLKSWSVFYKSGKGYGTIRCDNGQRADVKLRSHGGGITFGKHNIAEGKGKFSAVGDINELFGKYASAGGEGGAVKSRIGQALSKDNIDLDIEGKGTGGGFGFDFSGFRISPMTEQDRREMEQEKAKDAAKAAEKDDKD